MRALALVVLLALTGLPSGGAHADPPLYHAQVQEWATEKNWKLEDWRACRTSEETLENATSSFCWSARARDPLKGQHAGFYPRVMIELAKFPDEDAAKRRIANFSVLPAGLKGVEAKLYVLRTGFRLGDLVFVVTTESLMFEGASRGVAKDLMAKIAGTDYSCYGGCEPKKPPVPPNKKLAPGPRHKPDQPDQPDQPSQ